MFLKIFMKEENVVRLVQLPELREPPTAERKSSSHEYLESSYQQQINIFKVFDLSVFIGIKNDWLYRSVYLAVNSIKSVTQSILPLKGVNETKVFIVLKKKK